MHAPEARLSQVIDRFEQVEARLGAAGDPDEIVKLSKEHAELKPVAEKANELKAARAELDDLAEMMEGGDGFAANAAAAAAYYAELDLDPAFVNSNSKDCQSEVSMMWREVASSM